MMDTAGRLGQTNLQKRPWTVYVLVFSFVAGFIWSLFTDSDRSLWDIALWAAHLWMTYSLWNGKLWAFNLTFTLTALCGVGLVGVAMIQVLLLDMAAPLGILWGLLSSAILVALLMHPASRRFAGLGEKRQSSPPPVTVR